MKKLIISTTITSALLLGACGGDKDTTEEKQEVTTNSEEKENETNTAETQKEKVDGDSLEVKEGPLTKPGQWTMDGTDKVTLVKIKEVNQTYTLGSINLNIESIKLLSHSQPTEEVKNYVEALTTKSVEGEMNTIQVIYSVENTSDANIMFTAIDTITTDTKAQISGLHDIATSNDYGTYMGKVIVEGLAIYPYSNGSLEEINTVNIITGDVWDNDNPAKLADSQKIEIAL